MIEYFIELYLEKRNWDEEKMLIYKEIKIDCDIVRGEFLLVYLVVWFGNMCLFISLKENGFDILMKIRNGLNILDIVCMKNMCGELDVEF